MDEGGDIDSSQMTLSLGGLPVPRTVGSGRSDEAPPKKGESGVSSLARFRVSNGDRYGALGRRCKMDVASCGLRHVYNDTPSTSQPEIEAKPSSNPQGAALATRANSGHRQTPKSPNTQKPGSEVWVQ